MISNILKSANIYEITSAILSICAVYLDTKERVLARPLSLLSISFGLVVYIKSGLYAKCLLSVTFLVLNIYGWYQWKYGGQDKTGLRITRLEAKKLMELIVLGMSSAFILGYILHTKTSATLAYWDSINATFWLIAHVLLVKKKLENWLFWLVLDVSFAMLCYFKGLYVFSLMHALYLFLAFYGYLSWRRTYLNQTTANK